MDRFPADQVRKDSLQRISRSRHHQVSKAASSKWRNSTKEIKIKGTPKEVDLMMITSVCNSLTTEKTTTRGWTACLRNPRAVPLLVVPIDRRWDHLLSRQIRQERGTSGLTKITIISSFRYSRQQLSKRRRWTYLLKAIRVAYPTDKKSFRQNSTCNSLIIPCKIKQTQQGPRTRTLTYPMISSRRTWLISVRRLRSQKSSHLPI